MQIEENHVQGQEKAVVELGIGRTGVGGLLWPTWTWGPRIALVLGPREAQQAHSRRSTRLPQVLQSRQHHVQLRTTNPNSAETIE